jgi:N-acetylneuraminate synthase
MKFGLKVHHSDLSELLYMKPEALEFALFPGDMGGAWADKVKFDGPIAVHMPEKFSDGSLVDLASPYDGKRTKAIRVLKKTIDIAERLNAGIVVCHPGGVRKKPEEADTGPLLGSMEELKAYAPDGIELLLENMPDIYWYNGALHAPCLFKRADEVTDVLKKLGIGMCMDLSHAKLYCNSSNNDFLSYVESLQPLIRHIHVADARGVTAEGLQVSEGEIDFKALLPVLKGLDVIAVPEIMNGHSNRGAGFKVAAERLVKLGYFNGTGRR